MTVEVFAENQATTTITSGGTDAPSPGTSQMWTAASSAMFPAASSAATPPTQFHIADTAPGSTSEIIAVTNVSGTTWTVTRGAESTTPVAHNAGFAIYQVTTTGFLGGLPAALNATAWLNVTKTPYNADPAGASDSTTAFRDAITALSAFGGGVLYCPTGTYKLTPTSATVPALTIPSNVTLAGDGPGATTLLKNGNGILLDFSGPGPISETTNWNTYQSLRDLAINGNGNTGLLLRLYYVQFYYEKNVYLHDNADVFVDMVQCYDSRINDGLYLGGGSASASAVSGAQACTHLIRNSAAPATTLSAGISGTITALPVSALPAALPAGIVQVWNAGGQVQNFTTTGAVNGATSIPVSSVAVAHTFVSGDAVNGFGWSGDSSNALIMRGCHWEDGLSGALWLTPGVNNTSQLNEIYIIGSKVEEDNIGYNCPQIQVDPDSGGIHIDHLFMYLGGFNAGYSTAVTGIYFHPDNGDLSNVEQLNGSAATVSTGIDAGTTSGFRPMISNIFQFWNTSPTVAGFNGTEGTTFLLNFQINGTVTTYFTGTYALINDGNGDWEFTGTGTIGPIESYGLASFNSGTDTSGTATASTPSLSTGVAAQINTSQDVMLYADIHTSSTFSLAIGPTSTPATTIMSSATTAIGLQSVRVPMGWYVESTFTSAAVTWTAVTC